MRKAVAANLSGLLQALGKELTAQVMAPIFIELTKDEIWGVRKVATSSEKRTRMLTPCVSFPRPARSLWSSSANGCPMRSEAASFCLLLTRLPMTPPAGKHLSCLGALGRTASHAATSRVRSALYQNLGPLLCSMLLSHSLSLRHQLRSIRPSCQGRSLRIALTHLFAAFPTADLHPSLLALYTEMAAPPPDSSLDQVSCILASCSWCR